MKDIFSYFSMFMWRMFYLEKRDVQFDSYENNYIARQFNVFVRILMSFKMYVADELSKQELDLLVIDYISRLKADPVVTGIKVQTLKQFKVPMQLIDPVMKLINEVSYLDTVLDLGVVSASGVVAINTHAA